MSKDVPVVWDGLFVSGELAITYLGGIGSCEEKCLRLPSPRYVPGGYLGFLSIVSDMFFILATFYKYPPRGVYRCKDNLLFPSDWACL
jgi:hypothetical protein